MASGPIASWKIEGGKVEAVTDVLFFRSKMTAAMESKDCSMTRGRWKPRERAEKQA